MEIFRHQFSPARTNFYGISLGHVVRNGNVRTRYIYYPQRMLSAYITHPCQPIVATPRHESAKRRKKGRKKWKDIQRHSIIPIDRRVEAFSKIRATYDGWIESYLRICWLSLIDDAADASVNVALRYQKTTNGIWKCDFHSRVDCCSMFVHRAFVLSAIVDDCHV